MDELSKQYRRDLLTGAIRDGDLRGMIAEGLKRFGSSIVAIVACSNTEPGRGFLRGMAGLPGLPVGWQRSIREALTVHRAAGLVVPADMFMPLADHIAETLAAGVQDVLSRPGVVPVVVMGGGGTMTAGVAAVESNATVLQSLVSCGGRAWAVESPAETPASRERRRRADRSRRHGMN